MKSVMEETKIVESFTLLLYSRTYQKLYIEIFDIQTKNLLSKHTINTSDHEVIHLGMPLKQVHIMVKKSQDNLQIMNEFQFSYEQFSSNSTVQQLQNYIKLKHRFPQYQLLFQIFYRNKCYTTRYLQSDTTLCVQLRQSQEQRKNNQIKYLKEIARSNLFLLQFRVMNNFNKNNCKKKISLPPQDSLQERSSLGKNRKNNKMKTYDTQAYKFGKYDLKKNNYYINDKKTLEKVKSPKSLNDQKSLQQEQSFLSVKGQLLTDEKLVFMMRKTKKTLTYDPSSQKFSKKQNQQKKITFLEETVSLFNDCQNSVQQTKNPKAHSIIKERTQVTEESIHQATFPINSRNKTMKIIKIEDDQSDKGSQSVAKQEFKENIPQQTHQPRDNTIKNDDPYEGLRQLCKQRDSQRIKVVKSLKSSKITLNTHGSANSINRILSASTKKHKGLYFNQEDNNQISQQKMKTPLLSRVKSSGQPFYANLYLKTLKSIERQSKILNYVKSHCRTEDFPPFFKQNKLNNGKQKYYTKQDKIPYQMPPELLKQVKIFNLKKKKAQQNYLLKVRSSSNVKSNLKKATIRC